MSASAAILAPGAAATSTERFVLDDAESLAAGDLIRTAVLSDGRVTTGAELHRIAMPDDVPLIYSVAIAKNGTVYLGTGNDGKVFRLHGDRVEPFAETGQLLVASLAFGAGGDLYAGTIPEGKVYRIDMQGHATELVQLPESEHVWALAFDRRRNMLFAGTGPEGRVYGIDRAGAPHLFWDSDAGHVMSLALGAGGALYAGTNDDAVVARITGPGHAEIVYDFEGNEITAIDVRDGVLAVAANEFPEPPHISRGHAKQRSSHAGRAPRPHPGKGRIWRVGTDGRAEKLYSQDDGHIASVELMADGTIYGGTGEEGRIIRVDPDRAHATWIDVDERQVLALRMEGDAPLFVTGDAAAVYRIVGQHPRDAIWRSKVLDARFSSRWGELVWRGEGRLLLQTRSGNIEEPDETWSDWSTELTKNGPIRSPRARFLQIRARFDRDPSAVLWAVTAYFLPQNQRPIVHDVRLQGENEAATKRMRAERQSEIPEPSSTYKLGWEVDNDDDDQLRYRLRFRREGQSVWREILPPEERLTEHEYEWDTASVPDGFYVIRVEASDELDNPSDLALTDTADSEPIRIDNHAPRVERLRFARGHLRGRAVDSLGPVARLEYAVDGRPWLPVFPTDDIFDSATEAFDIDLSSLSPGTHIVAVRATDASGNVGSGEAQIRSAG